jgi:hypothetical protein
LAIAEARLSPGGSAVAPDAAPVAEEVPLLCSVCSELVVCKAPHAVDTAAIKTTKLAATEHFVDIEALLALDGRTESKSTAKNFFEE